MKNTKLYCLLLLTCTLFSCDKDLMIDTSPKADFNLFFEYLKNDYAYRDYHEFTMEELRQKWLPKIEASNTQATLANIMFDVINNELKDPHIGINSSETFRLITSSIETPLVVDESKPNFKKVTISQSSPYYTWGVVTAHPSMGYIYVAAFNSNIGGSNSLGVEDGVKEINSIIKNLNAQGVTSMIVDVRSEAGGTNYVPRYIVQRFANRTAIYMNEDYPFENRFKRKEWVISPEGDHGFREGKIALLSNGLTCSGAEFFVLAMLQRNNVVHIGSRSFGCAGNVTEKDLANGWYFQLTNSRTEFPNGDQYFKVGITPPIIVKNPVDYSFDGSDDQLMKRAIEELK